MNRATKTQVEPKRVITRVTVVEYSFEPDDYKQNLLVCLNYLKNTGIPFKEAPAWQLQIKSEKNQPPCIQNIFVSTNVFGKKEFEGYHFGIEITPERLLLRIDIKTGIDDSNIRRSYPVEDFLAHWQNNVSEKRVRSVIEEHVFKGGEVCGITIGTHILSEFTLRTTNILWEKDGFKMQRREDFKLDNTILQSRAYDVSGNEILDTYHKNLENLELLCKA